MMTIDLAAAHRIAGHSLCDLRTVVAAYSGRKVRPVLLARLTDAARRLKLPLPPVPEPENANAVDG